MAVPKALAGVTGEDRRRRDSARKSPLHEHGHVELAAVVGDEAGAAVPAEPSPEGLKQRTLIRGRS